MFTNKLLLRADEHGDVRVANTLDWRFAAEEMVVPVVFREMADLAREYPLVFLAGKPMLYALTGVEQGVNAYVAEDGRWLASYVPARLRAYPFALTPVPGEEDQFALVLDADAEQALSSDGNRLYENGKPSDFLNERMQLLKMMQRAESVTKGMVDIIRDAGLLVERNITVRREALAAIQVKGLQVIDEKAFNDLSPEKFLELRDQGLLPLIYSHLISMANLRLGPIAGMYPELASRQETSPLSLEGLLDSGNIQFN